jgi:hypothetical protein
MTSTINAVFNRRHRVVFFMNVGFNAMSTLVGFSVPASLNIFEHLTPKNKDVLRAAAFMEGHIKLGFSR